MTRILAVLIVLLSRIISAAESTAPPTFTQPPSAIKTGETIKVAFAVSQKTDVEVAVLNAAGEVVRHLAAGVVGGEAAPPAPLKTGLEQNVEWDGKDDYGQAVANASSCSCRVRAGMGVEVEKIVGGDPYAFWSNQSATVQDHAQWKVTGIEAKSDGSVYVIGSETSFGLPALRAYDARGNYLRTVFPPSAGKSAEDVKGWGVNLRADGTFALGTSYGWNTRLSNWGLMSGGLDYGSIWCAHLIPSPDKNVLQVAPPFDGAEGNREMTVGTDGSMREFKPGPVLAGEPLPKQDFFNAWFSALSSDGKSLFISGLGTVANGFWRDGQVWKVDLATRVPTPFFSLSDEERKDRTAIGNGTGAPYTAFHGVAVDADGRVFICDRQLKRIAVVDKDGKLIRSIPVEFPDAVAVSPKSKAFYVTTRWTKWGANGELKLLKFNDWSKDEAPAVTISLHQALGLHKALSHLAVVEDKGEVLVWVAYTMLSVHIYKDTGTGLELFKDFYESGPKQRALDLQHMEVDRKTGDAYIADSQGFLFRIRDWTNPQFEPCLIDAKTRIGASSIAIDSRSRQLYTKFHYKPMVRRWNMDGEFFTPATDAGASNTSSTSGGNEFTTAGESVNSVPVSLANGVVPPITCSWVFTGLWERGMAAGPGGVATIGVVLVDGAKADDYSGPLTYFAPDKGKAPWKGLGFKNFGGKEPPVASGVRFDPKGNLYAGIVDGKPNNIPPGFDKDKDYMRMGRIYKYAPTGSKEGGSLFPTEPAAPAKIYDVHYGPINNPPRFGVDEYGRIYYPNAIEKRVALIDNEGNPILSFGTYGNRDSMGGLPGDLVPTKDVPLAWPSSVDATDEYIYISDRLNVRLLRLAKTFQLAGTAKIKE